MWSTFPFQSINLLPLVLQFFFANMNYRFRCIITIFAAALFVIEILSVDPIEYWQHFEWTLYYACVCVLCLFPIQIQVPAHRIFNTFWKIGNEWKKYGNSIFCKLQIENVEEIFPFSFNSLLLAKTIWMEMTSVGTISWGFQYARQLRLYSHSHQLIANIFRNICLNIQVFQLLSNTTPFLAIVRGFMSVLSNLSVFSV